MNSSSLAHQFLSAKNSKLELEKWAEDYIRAYEEAYEEAGPYKQTLDVIGIFIQDFALNSEDLEIKNIVENIVDVCDLARN